MIWDEAKRELVIQEHGIDFGKINDVFPEFRIGTPGYCSNIFVKNRRYRTKIFVLA